jgi:RHS repeat-associated protein
VVTRYTYDDFGRLAQVIDPYGHVSQAVTQYDGVNRQVIAIDTFGQATQYDYQDKLRKVATSHALGTTTSTYDAVGNMVGMIDRAGRATEYTYDKLNRQTKVKDWSGAETQYDYDKVGNMLSTIDARNHTTIYVYDNLNRQIKAIDAVGKTTLTNYDNVGNILDFTDKLGRVTQYAYDGVNRLRFTTDALGNIFEQKYDKVGNLVERIDALGRRTVYGYDELNRLTIMVDAEQQVTGTGYDKVGNVLSQTDALGRVTGYKYDKLNRRTKVFDAAGNVTENVFNLDGTVKEHIDAEGRVTGYGYDAFGRLAKVTEADGHVSRQVAQYDGIDRPLITIDTFGQATQYVYDDLNRITGTIHALGTTINAYDAVGNLVDMVDRAGRQTTYTYDDLNRRIKAENWSGAITQYGYDAVGNMLSMTDARGNTSSYVYDELNHRTKAIDALNQTTTTEYDAVGNAISVTDPLDHKTSYAYDKVNRLRYTTTPLGNVFEQQYDKVGNILIKVDALGRQTRYAYDTLNRMIGMMDAKGGVSIVSYDGVGNVLGTSDELGRVTTYDYDQLNRRIKVTNALGYVTENVYNADGTVQKAIDALGRVTTYGYDAYGRSNKVTDPSGHVVSKVVYDEIDRPLITTDRFGQLTTYTYDDATRRTLITQPLQSLLDTYDANGNLIQSVDQTGRTTQHVYDKLNREVETVAADGGVTLHQYDEAGRLKSLRDPALNFTNYSYDADNRLIQETDPLGSRFYTYDAVGNRVKAIDRNGRTRSFQYDELNRIVEETWVGGGKTFAFGYDAVGNLLSESDGATAHSYVYDALNRLTADVTRNLQYEYEYDRVNNLTKDTESIGVNQTITSYTYDSRNLLTGVVRGDQSVVFSYRADGLRAQVDRVKAGQETITSKYTYDAYGRLAALKHTAGQILLADNLYILDDFDRLIQEVKDGQAKDIKYDVTNQVTGVEGAKKESYSYDQNGNRLTNTTDTGNRLVSDGVYNYVYDAEGNRIQRTLISSGEVTTYQWDYRNRLVGVQVGTKSIAYSYDSQDRRIAKFVNGDLVERYGHDGNDLAVVFNPAGQVSQRYLFGGAIDEVLSETTSSGMVWSLADRLGSVDLIVDDKGGVLDRVTFDSFGNKTYESKPEKAFRFGFTGREADPETGLYYYRARYYDPAVGRFISVDLIGFQAGDTNLYRYVFNSPTMGTDPTGHESNWFTETINNVFQGAVETYRNSDNWLKTTVDIGVQATYDTAKFVYDVSIFGTAGKIYEGGKKIATIIHDEWQSIGKANNGNLGDQLLYSADRIIAGFADVVSLGATTSIREALYGSWIKEQHQGALFTTGRVLGVAALTVVGMGAGSLAASGGTGARLAAAMVQSGVKMGWKGMAFNSTFSAAASLAQDIEHGGLNAGSFDKAFVAGLNGAIDGFKGGVMFGAMNPLGLLGKTVQFGLALQDMRESVTAAIGHFEKGEYLSGILQVYGAFDATKDSYHAGTRLGNGVVKRFNTKNGVNAEGTKEATNTTTIKADNELINSNLKYDVPNYINESGNRALEPIHRQSDPWLQPIGDTNNKIDFPTHNEPSPYSQTPDPWKTQCFIAGTEIITRDGTKNIEDIQVGDWVLSDDPNTVGEIEYKQVLQTFAKNATAMIDIFIDGEKITTTEGHPFWVNDVGWVKAKDLTAGMHLQTKTESWLDIDRVDKHIELTKVYNFEVEGFHTYFVSDLGFLVHNNCELDSTYGQSRSPYMDPDIPTVLPGVKDFEHVNGVVIKNSDLQVLEPGVQASPLEVGKKYIWVIDDSGTLRIGTETEVGPRQLLGHPTLVDGNNAHVGGEIKFNDQTKQWRINDSSGRYSRGRSPEERAKILDNAQQLFIQAGLNVGVKYK